MEKTTGPEAAAEAEAEVEVDEAVDADVEDLLEVRADAIVARPLTAPRKRVEARIMEGSCLFLSFGRKLELL